MWSRGKLDGRFGFTSREDTGRRVDIGREALRVRSSTGGRGERDAPGLSFVAGSLFKGGTTRMATPFS
jgi:hypothetical protein